MSLPDATQSRAAPPQPEIAFFETAPVAFDPDGITVTVPVTLTIKATVVRTNEQVRGWLIDSANGAATPNNGVADADWKYTQQLTVANKAYVFKAALVEVDGAGVETEVATDELPITTT